MRVTILACLLAAMLHAAAAPGIKVLEHVVFLEPAQNELVIRESIMLRNDGKLPYSDPNRGTVRFYVPDSAVRPPNVSATAPNAAPVEQPAAKTRERNVYKVDVPVQPGETRFDISYTVPFSSPGVFSGKVLEEEGRVWLVAPQGVSLKGDGLQPPRQDPTTRASIYEVKGREYKVELEAAAAGGGEDSGPSLDQILPRIYGSVYPILGLAFGVLALGFVLLYRMSVVSSAMAPRSRPGR
jgi:hypothetical protein